MAGRTPCAWSPRRPPTRKAVHGLPRRRQVRRLRVGPAIALARPPAAGMANAHIRARRRPPQGPTGHRAIKRGRIAQGCLRRRASPSVDRVGIGEHIGVGDHIGVGSGSTFASAGGFAMAATSNPSAEEAEGQTDRQDSCLRQCRRRARG
jgi:hypothetical protein